jgi:hypothetical protein
MAVALVLAPRVSDAAPSAVISVPRVDRSPTLEDFLAMKPSPAMEGKMAEVEGFIQNDPHDGAPASQRTVVYVGYDSKNLYVVFVAFDSQPDLIRGRLTRRDNTYDDDRVEIMLDSFHDRRRAYVFDCNPLGIQLDQLYTEGSGSDDSFDTLWDSKGKVTSQGYVVWIAIPFRSLRFPAGNQNWGLIFQRFVPRLNEVSTWPRVSSSVAGMLNQEGAMTAPERVSPGRNLQLTPYGVFRSFRSLDNRDPAHPVFESRDFQSRVGFEAKYVAKDRFVIDAALNPDFSQVESDQPQVTVNQRFAVFFPEKRQLFLENGSFFSTPINLLYTRNIADPFFVGRLTAKIGPYAVGALFADDRSPGEAVPVGDPLVGKRAYFTVIRLNRDVGKGSTVGVIYADRESQGAFNRVGGVDLNWKLGKNWDGNAQAITSSTQLLTDNGAGKPISYSYQAGPAYSAFVERAGRQLYFNVGFNDTSPGFVTNTGFFLRPDVRQYNTFIRYNFRPEGKHLISHGTGISHDAIWSHNGARLEEFLNANYHFQLERQTFVGVFFNLKRERLRPSDFSALTANQDYPINHRGVFFNTAFFKWLSANGETGWGTETNYVPATGPPVSVRANYFNGGVTLRPVNQLTIDNTYLLTRLRAARDSSGVFDNHIIRSRWNYQISRELSIRFITQYNTTLPNPARTSLLDGKQLNFDFLISYLLHPGTAFYIGYNSDIENINPSLQLDPLGNIQTTRGLATNDGRQFFVKLTYQFRF